MRHSSATKTPRIRKGPSSALLLALLLELIAASPWLSASEVTFLLNQGTDPVQLRALLKAPEANHELEFSVSSLGLRESAWISRAEQISDTKFRSGPNVQQTLTFLVQPDPFFLDRVYPAFLAGPEVGIVNLDYWLLETSTRQHKFSASFPAFFLGRSCSATAQVLVNQRASMPTETQGRYVALATHDSACQVVDGLTVIDTGNTPDWIRELSIRDLNHFRMLFTEKFGINLPAPILLLHAQLQSGQPSRYRGESAWKQTIFLRFFGDSWRTYDVRSAQTISKFVAHEVVHLWLGGTFHQAGELSYAWFHEGAAEYLSHSLVTDQAIPVTKEALEEAGRRLNSCLQSLGGRGLNQVARHRGSAPYDCGFTLQWLVDVHDRAVWDKSIWTRWREYLTSRPSREISWDGFLSWHTQSQTLHTLLESLFLPVPYPERVEALRDRLTPFGLGIESSPWGNSRTVRRQVLFHLLGEVCASGDIGFKLHEESVELDTGNRCGALSGNPRVRRLDGYDLLNAVEALHRHTSETCRKGGTLTFAGPDNSSLASITCNSRLAPLPTHLEIKRIGNRDYGAAS